MYNKPIFDNSSYSKAFFHKCTIDLSKYAISIDDVESIYDAFIDAFAEFANVSLLSDCRCRSFTGFSSMVKICVGRYWKSVSRPIVSIAFTIPDYNEILKKFPDLNATDLRKDITDLVNNRRDEILKDCLWSQTKGSDRCEARMTIQSYAVKPYKKIFKLVLTTRASEKVMCRLSDIDTRIQKAIPDTIAALVNFDHDTGEVVLNAYFDYEKSKKYGIDNSKSLTFAYWNELLLLMQWIDVVIKDTCDSVVLFSITKMQLASIVAETAHENTLKSLINQDTFIDELKQMLIDETGKINILLDDTIQFSETNTGYTFYSTEEHVGMENISGTLFDIITLNASKYQFSDEVNTVINSTLTTEI